MKTLEHISLQTNRIYSQEQNCWIKGYGCLTFQWVVPPCSTWLFWQSAVPADTHGLFFLHTLAHIILVKTLMSASMVGADASLWFEFAFPTVGVTLRQLINCSTGLPISFPGGSGFCPFLVIGRHSSQIREFIISCHVSCKHFLQIVFIWTYKVRCLNFCIVSWVSFFGVCIFMYVYLPHCQWLSESIKIILLDLLLHFSLFSHI